MASRRISGRESGRRREQRALILRHLDGPHPPKTYNHQMSFSRGFRWLLHGDVTLVKKVIASRPDKLVFEATGSHRNLVKGGANRGGAGLAVRAEGPKQRS